MRIHELRLQNFRRFEDTTIKFPERFSVIIGDNGSGKTAVLDGIQHVLFASRVLGPGSFEGASIRRVTIDGQLRLQLPSSVELQLVTHDGGEHHPVFPIWRGDSFYLDSKETWESLNGFFDSIIDRSRKESGVVFPLVAYYGTGRLWKQKSFEFSLLEKEGFELGYHNALQPTVNPIEFMGWFKALEWEVRKSQQALDIEHLECVKQVIREMVPEWEDVYFSDKEETLMGTVRNPDGSISPVGFNSLSDGYRCTVAMVADMAYRCVLLNPHFGKNAAKETPGVVLIDELDLHLHPNWQMSIVEDLKRAFPKVQFICTTHSPFIVQSLKSEELIVLDEEVTRGGAPYKRSIEEIAGTEMGVENVPRSERFKRMVDVAEQYFRLIAQGRESKSDKEVAELRSKLDAFEEEFGEDPTFVAMLRMERKALKV